nr:Gfo/Idh/MocA family oxidoreductase [Clavibacter sp. VKM Ac-2872]
MHAVATKRLFPDRQIDFVDPSVDGAFPTLVDCAAERSIAASIVHVCTPADTHVDVLEEALSLGAREIIVEKPIAAHGRDLGRFSDLLAGHPSARVIPVAVWPHARSIRHVRTIVARAVESGAAASCRLEMHQHKDRRRDAAQGRGGTASVFDVELPHMTLLARHLLGPVRSASVIAARREADPVACSVELRHVSGAVSTLHSSLDGGERERRLELTTSSGAISVELPRSREELHATVSHGHRVERVPERPLDDFLLSAYRVFVGVGEQMPVSMTEHLEAASLTLHLRDAEHEGGHMERGRTCQ